MEPLKKLRKKLHYFLLHRRLKKNDTPHQTCSLEQAQSIGLLFDATQYDNIEVVKKFMKSLKKRNKKVEVLGLVEEKKEQSVSVDHFTMKKVSWLYIPKDQKAKKTIDKNYDLLLNLYSEDCLPLEYISALSKAKYRVGRYIPEKTYCYDLMINLDDNKDMNHFIQQVEHYLNLIKS